MVATSRPRLLALAAFLIAGVTGCSTALTKLGDSRMASVEFVKDGEPHAVAPGDYTAWRPTVRKLLLGHRLSLTEDSKEATHVVTMAVVDLPDGGTHLRMLEVKPVRQPVRFTSAARTSTRRDPPMRDRSSESLDLVEANRRLGEEPPAR